MFPVTRKEEKSVSATAKMYISDVQEDDLEIAIKVSGEILWHVDEETAWLVQNRKL